MPDLDTDKVLAHLRERAERGDVHARRLLAAPDPYEACVQLAEAGQVVARAALRAGRK